MDEKPYTLKADTLRKLIEAEEVPNQPADWDNIQGSKTWGDLAIYLAKRKHLILELLEEHEKL